MANPNLYYDLIEKPLVTEKSSFLQAVRNQYTFRVAARANKSEIKKAIETLFGVTVEHVSTMNVPGKFRRTMGRPGRTPEWKKAVVTLREGDTIEVV